MLESYKSLALLQLLLLLSVMIIYLRSTSPGNLEPQKMEPLKEPPPADRLVVFVRDGLSAQTFLGNRCRDVPRLRELFLHEGLVGISRPETTTYHPLSPYISLFSGYNEDAARVARGWMRKPDPIDSIFDRSKLSFAWTTAKLLLRFPRIHRPMPMRLQTYDADVTKSCSELEDAVCRSVKSFLFGESRQFRNATGVVFFIHMTGVEPSCESLQRIQENVWKLYEHFEKSFSDRRTAYLFTSNLGDPKTQSDCSLAVESPFFLWGSGVAHIKSMPGRSFPANDSGYRLPLHVLYPPHLTALMSALLGVPPPVQSRGMLPRGMLNASVRYEANAMLTNARQLLAQARRLRELHPKRIPAFWLNFQMMDSFLRDSLGLKDQHRFKALLEYSCNFMPVLVKAMDYFKNYYRTVLVIAVSLAEIGWIYCLRCHLTVGRKSRNQMEIQEVTSSEKLVFARGFHRLLTALLVIFMMLERIPLMVQVVLLTPSLYWKVTLKILGERPKMVCLKSLISSATLILFCLGAFYRRYILAVGYLGFAGYNNREAFRKRGLQFYLWLLLLLGLTGVSALPESLGCSQPRALMFSILLTLLRPLACGVYLNLLTWLSNILVLLVACEFILVGWHPWIAYMVSWIYSGYLAIWNRRSLQASELVFFNLSTLYTLTCTSYESVIIQMLAMELQMALRMKLERNESIGPKTAAHYILVYSWYSLFVIGSFPAFDDYLDILHETCFGYLSLTYGLVMVMKLLLPWLLVLCVLVGNYRNLASHERQIFVRLLLMSSSMSLVLLYRVTSVGPWREILCRFAEFTVVHVFPLLWLLLWRLAQHKVGSKWMSQLPG
ncbi:GPI ethanolamine phosphate transferase 1 isoform X2 [Drosophila biarmipes]|uniref:GPI ethanolamine phosphate transferase 1 isoform X2 n=1 Tax=Drosophila biarmipes TaxID=125945 RepID=UPI0007E5D6D8|nr:GPI ethanolamine phosphate transferase 1 isoform X2 [Drosophila biarmipes]